MLNGNSNIEAVYSEASDIPYENELTCIHHTEYELSTYYTSPYYALPSEVGGNVSVWTLKQKKVEAIFCIYKLMWHFRYLNVHMTGQKL